MDKIPVICSQCGGQLRVDSSKDLIYCIYCGTQLFVKAAIQNYIVQNAKTENVNSVNIHKQGAEESAITSAVKGIGSTIKEPLVMKTTEYYNDSGNKMQNLKNAENLHMKILNCPGCSGSLEIDNGVDIFFCKYCGYKIILSGQSDSNLRAKVRLKELEHMEKLKDKDYAQKRYEKESSDRFLATYFKWSGIVMIVLFVVMVLCKVLGL